MNAGRVEQDGTPEDLYHRPTSRFVADFIGETNLLTCRFRGLDGDRVVLDWRGHVVHARAPAVLPLEGSAVEIAVRPESLQCSSDEPAGGNRLQGRILQRIFKGSRTTLQLELDGGAQLQASVDPFAAGGLVGDRVWIGFEPDRAAVLYERERQAA
jgi:spermidine/putrescine transport system ATP-binding protein